MDLFSSFSLYVADRWDPHTVQLSPSLRHRPAAPCRRSSAALIHLTPHSFPSLSFTGAPGTHRPAVLPRPCPSAILATLFDRRKPRDKATARHRHNPTPPSLDRCSVATLRCCMSLGRPNRQLARQLTR